MRALFTKKSKSALSVLLALCLLMSSLGVSMLFGSAITVETGAAEPFVADYTEDFEGGIANWSKTSMNYGVNASGGDVTGFRSSGGAYNDEFPNAYTYASATESDNKVLSLAKKGAGYQGATSVAISVLPNTEYTVSAIFKEFSDSTNYPNPMANGYYDANTAIVIKEFKTADTTLSNDLTYKKIASKVNSSEWQTLSGTFTTASTTKYVVIYLSVGSQWNVRNTIYFDDVSLVRAKYDVVNGDFEDGEAGEVTPDWTKVAMDHNTKKKSSEPSYLNAYNFKTELVDGDKVLAINKTGSGYIAAASKPFAVKAGAEYVVTVDYKLHSYEPKAGATNGLNYLGTALLVEEFDAAGTTLVVADKLTTLFEDHKNVTVADTAWKSAIVTYTPSANAASAVFYLYSGGQWNIYTTVYFDDLTVTEQKDRTGLYNGTFEKITSVKDGGRADGVNGPTGWTLYSAEQTGAKGTASYNENYIASIVEENGNKFVKLEGKNGVTQGYAALMSPFIAVSAGDSFAVSFDYKLEGTKDGNDYGSYVDFYFFDKDMNYISYYHPAGLDYTKTGAGWQSRYENHSDMKVPANAAYMKMGFWTGGRWGQTQTIDYYFDNVTLFFASEKAYWTEESCKESAIPYPGQDYSANYDIRKAAEGERDEFLKLVVTRNGGMGGGVVYYSEPVFVTAGTLYTTAFESKIKNSVPQTEVNTYGASVVVRWRDAEGNILSTKDLTGRRFDNMDWTKYEYDVTAPTGAATAEIGLVIGSYNWNVLQNLEYNYDNIVFMDAAEYDRVMIDPDVVNSVLYEKSALFVGDAIGSALAAEAEDYSKMVVTNVCGVTALAEQLTSLTETAYDYVIISIGDAEIKANMPAGTVATGVDCMTADGFDTATFAGLLEDAFAKITEYTEPDRVVYLLPTDNAAYKAVAEAATSKWGVALATLANSANAKQSWQTAIAPAESAPAFDSFAVTGFADCLIDRALAVSNAGLSFEAREILDGVIKTAERCPATHANYDDFVGAVESAKVVIAQYDDYAPLMLGATIASNDPNQLEFIAAAPKNRVSQGITVVKMGVLVMPAADMGKSGAAFEVGNSFVREINSDYESPSEAYYAVLSNEDADAFAEYAAVAYIIYKENGKEYTFYSANDYDYGFGYDTAEGGVAVKSVTGIAKNIAAALVAELENEVDFTAIGGAENKNIIATATEREDLKKVYRFVCDNVKLISKLFN